MIRKHIAVATIALSVALVACSKSNNSAKKGALPAPNKNVSQCPAAPAPLQSTGQTNVTVLTGSWSSPCLSADESWYGLPEIHTIQFNGNVLVETVVDYSDDQCKTAVSCPDVGQSHFSVQSGSDENHFNVSYSDGAYKSITDEELSLNNDGTISFSDEPQPFTKSN